MNKIIKEMKPYTYILVSSKLDLSAEVGVGGGCLLKKH